MPRTRTITHSFNSGEWSPLLDGRTDQDKYFSAAKRLTNFIPTVQGPARRRGGTRYVAATKTSANRSWLLEFVFSTSQAYVIEAGNLYFRFFTNRGQLLDGGSPYEVVTPYTTADLVTDEGTLALRTAQSGDIMWITHSGGAHRPKQLKRFGATNWQLVDAPFNNGPFRDINTDNASTVYASDVTGSVTVTASTAIFTSAHVGALFLIESAKPELVAPYQPRKGINPNEQRRNGGNVYRAVTATTIADPPGDRTRYVPVHTEGEADDGWVVWEYLHSGYGHGRITAVADDGLSCTMTVLSRLPDEVVGLSNATRRWAHGEFSAAYGWPTDVTFFRERLVYVRGRQLFMSVVNDFDNFGSRDAGLVTKETALSITMAADRVNQTRWVAPSNSLLVGTQAAELSLQEQTTQAVFAADNKQIVPQTEYGARSLRPLRVGESVLFVERAGHRVRDMRYSFEINRYKAEDLTPLSEHLFDGSEIVGDLEGGQREIIDWTYQQQRDSIVWTVLTDGGLAALVLNRERGVIAWTPHYIGGPSAKVEAVRAIPSPDGKTDDLWLIVNRQVGGTTQRVVEYMTDYRLVKLGSAEAVHVDCSVTYRGAATNTITGLAHMNGQTVRVWCNGSNHPPVTVSGGSVTLDRTVTLAHVGYGFSSQYQTMRLEVPSGGATAQSTRKAISQVILRVQSTVGGRVGPSFDKMDRLKTLDPKVPVGTPPVAYSGDVRLDFPGGFETDGYVCYEQSDPAPATLVALITVAQIND